MDTLPQRLASARKARHLTQEQLAKAAGISQSAVANIEAGTRVGLPSLAPLAHVLQVRYWWLRDGAGPMELAPDEAWPFSDALLAKLRELDDAAIEKAENSLRILLDMQIIRPNDPGDAPAR